MKPVALVGCVALLSLCAFPTVARADEAKQFPDVPPTHYAADAVNQLAQKGILQGYPDGTYGGSRAITRYEVAQGLQRFLNVGVKRVIDQYVEKLQMRQAPSGPRGAIGPQGARGPRGEQGPQGEPGAFPAELREMMQEMDAMHRSLSDTAALFQQMHTETERLHRALNENGYAHDILESRTEQDHRKVHRLPFGPTPPAQPSLLDPLPH